MSRLPEQEETQGTYYGDQVARFQINEITTQSGESAVTAAWTAILNFVFPLADGYLTSSQTDMGIGPSDLFTSQVVAHILPSGNEAYEQRNFLIVKCMAPEYESRDLIWKDGAQQLERYLEGMTRSRGRTPAITHTVYGAVAIGRYVRLYSYQREVGTITNLLNEDSEPLHIAQECASVDGWLRHMKQLSI